MKTESKFEERNPLLDPKLIELAKSAFAEYCLLDIDEQANAWTIGSARRLSYLALGGALFVYVILHVAYPLWWSKSIATAIFFISVGIEFFTRWVTHRNIRNRRADILRAAKLNKHAILTYIHYPNDYYILRSNVLDEPEEDRSHVLYVSESAVREWVAVARDAQPFVWRPGLVIQLGALALAGSGVAFLLAMWRSKSMSFAVGTFSVVLVFEVFLYLIYHNNRNVEFWRRRRKILADEYVPSEDVISEASEKPHLYSVRSLSSITSTSPVPNSSHSPSRLGFGGAMIE